MLFEKQFLPIAPSIKRQFSVKNQALLFDDATMTQNFSKGMEANFRSIFHKLMAMPESKTKLTGEKKS
jgi:hypothetical protein